MDRWLFPLVLLSILLSALLAPFGLASYLTYSYFSPNKVERLDSRIYKTERLLNKLRAERAKEEFYYEK